MRALARRTTVEADAEGLEPPHRLGAGRGQHRNGIRGAKARTGGKGVESVQPGRILRQHRGRDPTLRSLGRCRAGRNERHTSAQARGFKSRGGTREPISYNQNVGPRGDVPQLAAAAHSSTIRLIAPRARSATASGTVTSNTSSRSEVRSFSSVIFFM